MSTATALWNLTKSFAWTVDGEPSARLPSTSVTIFSSFPGQKLSKIVTAAGRCHARGRAEQRYVVPQRRDLLRARRARRRRQPEALGVDQVVRHGGEDVRQERRPHAALLEDEARGRERLDAARPPHYEDAGFLKQRWRCQHILPAKRRKLGLF